MFTLFLGFEEFTWREVFKIKDKFGHVDEDILKKVSFNLGSLRYRQKLIVILWSSKFGTYPNYKNIWNPSSL